MGSLTELELEGLLQGLGTEEWKALSQQSKPLKHHSDPLGTRLALRLSEKCFWHTLALQFDFTQNQLTKNPTIRAGALVCVELQPSVVVEVSQPLALQLLVQLFGGQLENKPASKKCLTPIEQRIAESFAVEVAQRMQPLTFDITAKITVFKPNLTQQKKWETLLFQVTFLAPPNSGTAPAQRGILRIHLNPELKLT